MWRTGCVRLQAGDRNNFAYRAAALREGREAEEQQVKMHAKREQERTRELEKEQERQQEIKKEADRHTGLSHSR